MSEQQPATGTDITAADLEVDIEVPTNAPPATSDPDAFVAGSGWATAPTYRRRQTAAVDAMSSSRGHGGGLCCSSVAS